MTRASSGDVGAVLLVGGAGRRLGGVVKPLLRLQGHSLLERAVEALAAAGVGTVVAVGPQLADLPGVVWAHEDPPAGGPVAGIAAGLAHVREDWVFLLAGDLVHPEVIVQTLSAQRRKRLDAGDADAEGYAFTADHRQQWLAGLYRTTSVRAALHALETERDAPVRDVLGGLAIEWILDEDGVTADIDSPADLDRARADLEERT